MAKRKRQAIKLRFTSYFLPIGLLTAVLMVYFKNSAFAQLELLIMLCVFYIIGAGIYHHHDKTLTLEVIIEYVLIAVFSISLISGFLIY